MPGAPVTDLNSGPGFPVSASVSRPFPASGCPPTKSGLALPPCTAQSTGADTKGAVFPVESFRTSPREMFSTLMVNFVGWSCATAAWAAARNAAENVTARTSDMRVSRSGRRRERRGGEVDAEAAAPDRDGPVLRQIEIVRHIVVLVALVALELAQLDEAGLGDGLVVRGIGRGHQIHPDVRPVGCGELREPQDPASADVLDRRGAMGLVGHRVEPTGRERAGHRGADAGDLLLIHLLVHEQQLGAEEIPPHESEYD